MTKTYTVMNKWAEDADMLTPDDQCKMTINASLLADGAMMKIWCINFRDMTVVDGELVGVDDNGQHYVVLNDDAIYSTNPDTSAWAVPVENIFYDKHSAEKALFTAHLKYERD